jgi:two-component sensor histidine kinase
MLFKFMPGEKIAAVVARALARALERRSAANLAEQERIALQSLYAAAPIGLGLIGRDLRIDRANPALVRLLRLAEGAGIGTLWETLPAAREALEAPLLRILAGGDAPASGVRLEFRDLSAPAAEAHRVLNLRLYGVPDADGSGQAFAAGLVCQDVTAETTLVRELDHRVKNAFASCLGLVQVAARTATEPETRAMAKDLGQRINALSRAHDLVRPQISGASRLGLPQRVEFVALARLILAAHMSEAPQRITLRGPPTMIGPQTAPGMALLLHELATNALKYGALSLAGGVVVLEWVIDGPLFRLEWSEAGGPPVSGPPARSGFGSRLLRQPDLGALRRGAVMDWGDPAGLRARLAVPVADLAN